MISPPSYFFFFPSLLWWNWTEIKIGYLRWFHRYYVEFRKKTRQLTLQKNSNPIFQWKKSQPLVKSSGFHKTGRKNRPRILPSTPRRVIWKSRRSQWTPQSLPKRIQRNPTPGKNIPHPKKMGPNLQTSQVNRVH